MPDKEALTSDRKCGVAILLCRDLAKPRVGLDLKRLCRSIEDAVPGAAVEVFPDLCNDLGQVPLAIHGLGAERVVLGLCTGEYSGVELQSRMKKAGLDPFAAEAVSLGSLCAASGPILAIRAAQTLLKGAASKVLAFRGSSADNTKLRVISSDQKMTRRALFTVRPVGYSPVPQIVRDRCAASAGCQLCATVCPGGALQKAGEKIALDKAKCETCGICVAACPRDAIDFPGSSLAQISAQLSAMLQEMVACEEPGGIVFTCKKGAGLENLVHKGPKHSCRWLPVTVPCLGMVTPGWILQVLAGGAASVALLPCQSDCRLGQKEVVKGRIDYCQMILPMLGQPVSRVVLLESNEESRVRFLQEEPLMVPGDTPPPPGPPLRLDSNAETLNALRGLRDGALALDRIFLEHAYSPFGRPELRNEGCTGCRACVRACPTGALSYSELDGESEIFLAPSACNGCGICAETCPENSDNVLTVRRATDLAFLSEDPVALCREHHDGQAELTCEACGGTVDDDALVRRVAELLKENNPSVAARLSRYCAACRASLAWTGSTSGELKNYS